ncbi:MAG: nucleotidyl transferase AbiEii/AbiGii toxin family protein [Actinobacteria bacterium]|nr:nucleotidyl transferase AbiEii/AbiGii toxin family protein [Actinomycetota bacterium]
MEQLLAERLAGELKIDITQVVREYWEVLFLKGLLESTNGNELVFKGGTALRLAFGSPRFSEDLDFALQKDTLAGKFEDTASVLVDPFHEAEITDVAEKRWTYLCEIRITEGYLPHSLRVKLEVSRRPARGYQSQLRLITSPATPLQVLGRVVTLEQLYRDKLACLEGRSAAKDIFDLWFICQKLKIPYRSPETSVSRKELRRDLGKYLPADYRGVIEELL